MTTTSIGPQHSRHVFANGSEAPRLLHDQWQAKSAERRIGIREHPWSGVPRGYNGVQKFRTMAALVILNRFCDP